MRGLKHILQPDKGSVRTTPSALLARGLFLWLLSAPALAAEPGVEVDTADTLVEENLRAHLSVARESCELPGWREPVILRGAREDSRRALKALGYYEPRIQLKIERSQDCWTLRISLEPGVPVRVRTLDIRIEGEARDDAAFQRLLAEPAIAEGDIVRHDRYERLRNRLVELASERGYFDSELTRHELLIEPARHAADIHLHLASGPRYHFGATTIDQDVLDEDFVQRFVPYRQGEPFHNDGLLRLRQDLSRGGYFNEVRISTEPEAGEPLEVPVGVNAVARPRYGFLAGIGFATDTGPRLRLGLEDRRVNRRGHSYHADVEASAISTGAGYNYRIPLEDPNREYINLSTSYLRDETDTSLSERYRVGIARVSERSSGWVMTRSLEWMREQFTVADQDDRADLLMPGLEMSRVKADDSLSPRRGWRLNGKVRFASGSLGSTLSFTQFRGNAKGILPVPGGRLLGRLTGGATLADELVELPASVRFFAGGDDSVRGYGYEELGPENDDGDVIGGRHLLTGSLEYEYSLFGRWSLALFMDAGNAYDQLNEFEPARGVGTGIRWRSPIGPIRVDVARPLDQDRDSLRLHISMGPDL